MSERIAESEASARTAVLHESAIGSEVVEE